VRLLLIWILLTQLLFSVEKNDFAYGREVRLNDPAGLVRVDLELSLFSHLEQSDFSDITIIDAEGDEMPHNVVVESNQFEDGQEKELLFSSFKQIKQYQSNTLSINYNGEKIALSKLSALSDEDYIVNTASMREGIDTLQFSVEDEEYLTPISVAYSNDMVHWRTLRAPFTLANLKTQGVSIEENELKVHTPFAKYIKIHPKTTLRIYSITAKKVRTKQAPLKRYKISLRREDGAIIFKLPAHVYIDSLEFELPKRDQFYAFNLQERNDENEAWSYAQPREIYRMLSSNIERLSILLYTQATEYKITPQEGSYLPKELTLYARYHDISLYFLAQGVPPYTLVYGSQKVTSKSYDLTKLIANHKDVEVATLAEERTVNLEAKETPKLSRDYSSLFVWLFLIIGVGLLGFMSYKLLSEQKETF